MGVKPPRQEHSGRAPMQPQTRAVGAAKGSQLHCSLSVRPPANYFAHLSLSFYIHKMGIIIPIVKS